VQGLKQSIQGSDSKMQLALMKMHSEQANANALAGVVIQMIENASAPVTGLMWGTPLVNLKIISY
jgi:hypothetical protein